MNKDISTYINPLNDPRGMKWHKFLVYFSLWIGALLNFLTGYIYLSYLGADHFSSYLYSQNKVLLTGILAVIAGIYAIIARFRLARFKSDAIVHLIIYTILVLLSNVAISVVESTFSASVIVSGIAFFALTYTYYNKRRDLFTC